MTLHGSAPLALTAVLFVACARPPVRVAWPGDAWVHTAPEQQGVHSDGLASLVAEARRRALGLHSLLVVRHRAVVLDVTFFPFEPGRAHDIASCTKSLTSLGVGLALGDGSLRGIDAPLLALWPQRSPANLDARKRSLTLRHALTMRAGLQCESAGEQTLVDMQASPQWVDFVADLPMAEAPGSTWRYCSPVSHLLSGAVTAATGRAVDELLTERLLRPLGVTSLRWPRDPQGVSHGWGDAELTPQDLARLGVLVLEGGAWNGRRLLDEAWLKEATAAQVTPSDPTVRYGYQWWSKPGETIYASGRGGQFLLLVPALDLVVVTTGASSALQVSDYAALLAEHLLPAVSPEASLPDSGAGTARLAAELRLAAQPPPRQPPAPVPPELAASLGRRFTTEQNPFGWRAVTVRAPADDELAIDIELSDGETTVRAGLDGVPRLSTPVSLTAQPRSRGARVAATALLTTAKSLEVQFDSLERIDAGTLTLRFEGGQVQVTVNERTLLAKDVTFVGHAP